MPFSDKEPREEGHGVKVSGSYVVPGFYECSREVLNDNDVKNCAQQAPKDCRRYKDEKGSFGFFGQRNHP